MTSSARFLRASPRRLPLLVAAISLTFTSPQAEVPDAEGATRSHADTVQLALGEPIRDYAVIAHRDTVRVAVAHNAYFTHADTLVYSPDDKDGKSPLGYYVFVGGKETASLRFQDALGLRDPGIQGDDVFLGKDGRLIHICQKSLSFWRCIDGNIQHESIPVDWQRQAMAGVSAYHPGCPAGDGCKIAPDFFVIHDATDQGFMLALDNMFPYYRKDYLIEVSHDKVSSPMMIESGDVYCTSFQSIRRGDSLYGAWVERKTEWSWIRSPGPTTEAVCFSSSDGHAWSRPSVVVPPETIDHHQPVQPVGLFVSEGRWHVLWVSRERSEDYLIFQLHVSAQDSLSTWQELPTDIPLIRELDYGRMCHITTTKDGRAHLIAGYPGAGKITQYLVFSQGKWLYGGDVLHGACLQSLVVDGDVPYLVWTDTRDRSRILNVLSLADRPLIPTSDWQR